jgi:lipopolysaccharide transport system ATP-binding protein
VTQSQIAVSAHGVAKRYRLGQLQGGYQLLSEVITQRLRGSRPPKGADETFWALHDVEFDVATGETFGIIGHNGAGKSTLLKILARVTPPTAGEIRLMGRVGALLEVGTGFHAELTGRENIFLNGAILGMRRTEIQRKFDEIVEFAEVEQFIDTPVKRYSSGMYLRLAFAVAAHLEPEILIVDEVLSVGDLRFQEKCLGRMETVAAEGRTVLFVSHNLTAVSKLCTRAMLLSGGRKVIEGRTPDVISEYVATATSRSDSSLAERQDRSGNGRLRFTELKLERDGQPIDMPVTGKPLDIVLRYETTGSRVIEHPRFAIGVTTVMGEVLMHLESDASGGEIRVAPEHGEVVCRIPRLPLPPGRYTVGIAAAVGLETLDTVSRAAELTVAEGDFYESGIRPSESHRTVLVDHRWTISGSRDPLDLVEIPATSARRPG